MWERQLTKSGEYNEAVSAGKERLTKGVRVSSSPTELKKTLDVW